MTSPQPQSIQVLTNPLRNSMPTIPSVQNVTVTQSFAPAITTVIAKTPAISTVVNTVPSGSSAATATGPTVITQIKTEQAQHVNIAAQSPIAVKHAQQQAIQV